MKNFHGFFRMGRSVIVIAHWCGGISAWSAPEPSAHPFGNFIGSSRQQQCTDNACLLIEGGPPDAAGVGLKITVAEIVKQGRNPVVQTFLLRNAPA